MEEGRKQFTEPWCLLNSDCLVFPTWTLLCDTVGGLTSLKPFSLCIYQLDRLADNFHPQANYVENHTCGLFYSGIL